MQTDSHLLRRTFAVAAVSQAGEPFRAVLVGPNGQVLLEESDRTNTQCHNTGHIERTLAAKASRAFDAAFLLDCSVYSSAEPCAAAAGAVYCAGIGRVVFGMPPSLLERTGRR